MEGVKKSNKPNPRASANWLSAVTFWWTIKVFINGLSREIEVGDLYEPLKEHKADRLGGLLEKHWQRELSRSAVDKKSQPSLVAALVRTFGPRYLIFGLVQIFMELAIKVVQPLFLGRMIRYFSPGSTMTSQEAYLYAGGVIGCSAIQVLILHPYIMGVIHMGMKMRIAACSLIYRKSLRLSHSSLGRTTAGQVLNLVSNDVGRFEMLPIFMHDLWLAPLELLVCCYFMWTEMGPSAMVGVTTLLLTIPLQLWLGKKTSQFRYKTAVRTDERVRLMNEIISGIQVIKMYAWEKAFAKLVAMARRTEMKTIRFVSLIRGINKSFVMFTTRMTVCVSVVAYVLMGNQITAEKVFVMTSYYNIIRYAMTMFFPQAVTQCAEGMISTRRIQTFLLLEEVSGASHVTAPEDLKAPPGVRMEHATARWSPESAEPTLSDVTLRVRPGDLMAIIGPVGAGKSSLLSAVLGELPLSLGKMEVRGRLSYAAQEPWLFSGSLRENILFGSGYEAGRYREVVRVCALQTDLAMMPHGDRTVVGERGVALSGGQRARVSLARAVYKQADIYLLDDPLSAVDAHVGRHLFEECIRGFLGSKCVMLVTHQLQFLSQASTILVLDNGHVEAAGSFASLQARAGLDLNQLISERDEMAAMMRQDSGGSNTSRLEGLVRQISARSSISSSHTRKDSCSHDDEPKEVAEIRSSGTVSGKVYGTYLRAGGNTCSVLVMFLTFVLAQLAASGADVWLTFWTNLEESRWSFDPREFYSSNSTLATPWLDTPACISIYTVLVVCLVVMSLYRSILFFSTCMRASVRLHDDMFAAITRATMAFFNNNTSGRILNRFSKDMGAIDEMLPQAMIDALQIGLTLLGIIIVVAIVNFWMLIPTFVIAILFYFLRVVFLTTSRSIKRIEGVTRSPVYSHLTASIQGLTTIRAFEAQEILESQFDEHQDLNSSAYYLFIATNRAFGFWLDIVCVMYISLVTLSFIFLGGETFGANVGLAITQSIGLTGMFQWGMRQSAEVENQMTGVERIIEFCDLESEPPLETSKENEPPKGWPKNGEIKFDNISLNYIPSENLVLNKISFIIKSGEKVGIVGRTGAGKSSLISALFRLANIPNGYILIDNIDTSKLGMHKLRSSISIIPQEPVLFSGTMRKNLDPFDEYTDDILWKTLDEVELKDSVSELSNGLYAHMSEGGSNFSVGQRQLVCLARAILRNNRILVLDEATANVDQRTDGLIQSTIRQKFAHCTVLTIAHRLNTIMDSDRVLVMDAGKVAEFAPPGELMKNRRSLFSKMARQQAESQNNDGDTVYI